MSKKFVTILTANLILLLFSTINFAQNDSRTLRSAAGSLYVISAKAGGVNFVQGDVSVLKNDKTSNRLIKGDQVESGEKVSTDSASKAEILLNPGSFARLGANTEFEFLTTSLDDLKLRLNRGSAIFEVYASNDFIVSVEAAKAKFYLIKSGVYRVDVLANGQAKLEVWKGRAQLGNSEATVIKKKSSAIMGDSKVSVQKFKKNDEKDSFDDWSKSRARLLAKINSNLKRKRLRSSLYQSFNNNPWDFNSYGLWAFSPRFGSYCFLPFSYGWRSPYGFGFGRNFFSSRPSNSFYYAVLNRTNQRFYSTRTTRRTNRRNNASQGNRGQRSNTGVTSGRRNQNRGSTNRGTRRNRGVSPGGRRTSPRRVSPPRPRVQPARRPASIPRRRTVSPTRIKSEKDN